MTRLLNSSLRLRLFVLVFLTLLPAFVLIVYNGAEETRRATAEAEKTALQLVRLAAESHEQLIEDAHDLLMLLSRLPIILLDRPACNTLFKDLPQRYPKFSNFAVMNLRGDVTCSSLSVLQGMNFAERLWFQEVLKTRKFSVSEYLIGKRTANPTVVFALPLLNAGGEIAAVVGLSVQVRGLNRLIDLAQLPAGVTFTVIDKNGTILARQPDPEKWIGKSSPEAGMVRAMLTQKREGKIEASGIDGVPRLYAFTPVGKDEGLEAWHVAIGIPQEVAYSHVRHVLKQNLIWMTLVTILVLAAAWVGGHRLVVRRIQSLVEASHRLGKGDLDTRTGMAQEQDEIGQLAGAFDQMAEALQSREADRREAEQTRARLAAIVESSTDAIVGRTPDGLVTSWNTGAEALFGYSKEEMIGRPIVILVPPDKIERFTQNFERVKLGKRIDSYETVRLRKGGRPIHVSVTVSPVIDERGKIIGASSITRDITERKQAENKLKALHDLNLAITSTLDLRTILQTLLEKIEVFLPYAASHIRLVNQTTGKMEPVACRNMDDARWKAGAEEGIQHPIHRAILQSKRPVTIRNMQEDESVTRPEFYRAQGLVSYLGVPLTVKGEVIGILSLLTRVEHEFDPEEIEFAEALAEQASMAIYNSQLYEEGKRLSEERQASENQIRTLASGMTHARDMEAQRIARVLHDESGQLLATVYIALDEMAKGISPSAREKIQKVKGLLDCVEARLRDLSHELHPTILDHLGLLPCLEFLAQQVSERSGVRVKIEGELNGRLSPLYELTLYRVVQEALNNATRHSQAKTVDVRVFEDQDLIRCSIQDNGVGFDPEALARRTVGKGQGVGLAEMRQRVEAVRGTFQVISVPGQGTQLLVAIPREKLNGSSSAAS